jgi:hypothetical protein
MEVNYENSIRSKDYKAVNFKIMDEDLGIKKTKKIFIIENIRKISEEDFVRWFTSFEEVMSLNKWTVSQMQTVLRVLVKDPTVEKIYSFDSFDIVKKEIQIKRVFRKEHIRIFLNLNKTRQRDFKLIRDYFNEIKKHVKQYALLEKISEVEYNKKLRKSFMNGLSYYTKMNIAEYLHWSLINIVEFLEIVENDLIQDSSDIQFYDVKGGHDEVSRKDIVDKIIRCEEKSDRIDVLNSSENLIKATTDYNLSMELNKDVKNKNNKGINRDYDEEKKFEIKKDKIDMENYIVKQNFTEHGLKIVGEYDHVRKGRNGHYTTIANLKTNKSIIRLARDVREISIVKNKKLYCRRDRKTKNFLFSRRTQIKRIIYENILGRTLHELQLDPFSAMVYDEQKVGIR